MEQPNLLTSFSRVNLSELEEAQGQLLTSAQLSVIQNARASLAEEIIHLTYKYNVNNPVEYGTELAYLQGQLDALTNLINLSDAANNLIIIQPEGE